MIDPVSGEIQPLCFSGERERGRGAGERRREEEQGAGSKRQSTGSREQGAGGGERSTGIVRSCSPLPAGYPLGGSPLLVSRSILQEAVRVQRAMLVASVADDPRFHAADSIRQMGIRSAICVPLYHQGQVTGVIYVASEQMPAR